MMVAMLKRGVVPAGAPMSAEEILSEDIVKTSAELLGYHLPTGGFVQGAKNLASLQLLYDAMKKHDIRPFVPSYVTRYKRNMEGKHKMEGLGLYVRLSTALLIVVWLSFGLGLLSIVGAVYEWAMHDHFGRSSIGILGSFSAFILCYIVNTTAPRNFPEVKWHSVDIRNYKGVIPEFVLQTACDLRRACPRAVIEVEELVVEKAVVDPFLVVSIGSQRYYVEVWNEPEFKQKRVW